MTSAAPATPMHLVVLPITDVRQPLDLFQCRPLNTKLSARSCSLRQLSANPGARPIGDGLRNGSSDRLSACRDCADGKIIAAAIGPQEAPEPKRFSRPLVEKAKPKKKLEPVAVIAAPLPKPPPRALPPRRVQDEMEVKRMISVDDEPHIEAHEIVDRDIKPANVSPPDPEWRTIADYPAYEIAADGRARRIATKMPVKVVGDGVRLSRDCQQSNKLMLADLVRAAWGAGIEYFRPDFSAAKATESAEPIAIAEERSPRSASNISPRSAQGHAPRAAGPGIIHRDLKPEDEPVEVVADPAEAFEGTPFARSSKPRAALIRLPEPPPSTPIVVATIPPLGDASLIAAAQAWVESGVMLRRELDAAKERIEGELAKLNEARSLLLGLRTAPTEAPFNVGDLVRSLRHPDAPIMVATDVEPRANFKSGWSVRVERADRRKKKHWIENGAGRTTADFELVESRKADS